MDFEWDERKRAQIIEDRALDLASAYLFFDGRSAIHQPTPRHGEERWKTTAEIKGAFFTAVWMRRGETIWPAPGSADTELGVLMEPEVCHGATEVYTGVQA
jgi:uncharacterized DUF497 family protein